MAHEKPAARVILVDDHPLVRQGLAGLLQDEGFEVVGTAATAPEAQPLLARAPVDLVVVDLTLEHGTGLALLPAIRRDAPGAAVVVYSVHEDGDRVRHALEAGAMGYVTKREDPEVLLACLRQVRSGQRFLSPRASRAMADAVAHGAAPVPEDVLSRQEQQVYELVGHGHAAPEIAQRMGLSVRTVETY